MGQTSVARDDRRLGCPSRTMWDPGGEASQRGRVSQKGGKGWQMKTTEIMMGRDLWMWVQRRRLAQGGLAGNPELPSALSCP